MTAEEQRSFLNTLSVLKKWKVCLVLPENVSADSYCELKSRMGLDFSVVFVRCDWMGSLTNYNNMLLAPEFYKTFSNYRYLLVCHLDAWVFRDELQMWIDKGYDYIGAPWFVPRPESSKDWAPLEKLMLPQGGNGGFCLRKIDKMIELLSNRKRSINVTLFLKGVFFLARNKRFDFLKIFVRACRGVLQDAESYQKKHNVYEDAFISIFYSFLDRKFSVAPAKDAKYFCVETNAAELLMTKMKWRLPFAVHGYDKYFSSLQEFDSYRNNVPRNEYTKHVNDPKAAKADRTGRLPKITVITATHNIIKSGRLAVFRQCVESVHTQTYGNIEHIIIDGASNDGTLGIVQEYVDKGWCICYSEKDDGPWDAMYRGHERATGEFVNILNSDDYFCRNDAVEIAAKALAKRKGDWFFSEGWFIRPDGTRWTMAASFDGLFGCLGILHQSVYVRTEILRGINAFRSNHISRENHLMMLLYVNGFKHVYSKKKLVCYREGGFSSNEYVGERFASDFVSYMFQSVGRFWGLTEQECRGLFGFDCFTSLGVEACWRLAKKLRIRQLRVAFTKRLVVYAWKNKKFLHLAGEAMPLLRPVALRAKALEIAPRDSIETMLSQAPDSFVSRTYQMILGREPDPSGLEHYRSRLRQGSSRLQIIADLRLSEEGRRFNAVLPGLDKEIRPYKLQRLPVIGLIMSLLGIRAEKNATARTNMMQTDIQVADGNNLFSLRNKEFVYSVFKIFLGRNPEPSAVAHYTKILKKKRARTVLLDIAMSEEAVAFRRRVIDERDRLKTECDALRGERDVLRRERDALRGERDALLAERDALLAERGGLLAERDALLAERGGLLADRGGLLAERGGLLADRDALRNLRNILRNENYGLRSERDALLSERGVMQSDFETMRSDQYIWKKSFSKRI
jgi:glycosyltransferase involved in cell wall biosynthesis